MANPSVAIILINWNGYRHTRACLASLSEIEYDNFQVIVIDNCSADDSLEKLIGEFSEVDFVSNKANLGFAGGNNVGIKKAISEGFEYITLLNNDTTVQADFLGILIDALRQNNQLGAVQPQIRWMHEPDKIWNMGGDYNSWTGQTKSLKQNQQAAVMAQDINPKWLTGCCICLPTEVIARVGMLDEAFFAYYEDVDWSFRITEQGYDLGLVSSSIVYHVAGASSNTSTPTREGRLSPQVHFLNIRNQIWIIKRYLKGLRRMSAMLFSVSRALAILGYFVLRGRRNKYQAVINGLKEGFQV